MATKNRNFCLSHSSDNATTTNRKLILVYIDMLNLNLAVSDLKPYSFAS